MKANFSAKLLSDTLRQIGAVVDGSSKIEIYRFGKLAVDGDGNAIITGISLGASLSIRIPAKEAEAGETLFTFKAVSDVISSIGVEEVIFQKDKPGPVQITGVGSNYVTAATTEDLTKFPSIIEEQFTPIASLGLPGFKDLIKKIDFAVPDADGKYTVTTALLHSEAKQLHLVATDGHRLAQATLDLDPGSEFRIQMPKNALELAELLQGDAVATISESGTGQNEGAFLFTTGKKNDGDKAIEALNVRKSSGTFPPYERIFQNTPVVKGALQIKQADFAGSLVRLLPMADSELPIITLTYVAGTSQLTLKAKSDAYGFAYDAIPVTFLGEAASHSFEAKINGRFLKEFIDQASGEISFFVPAANDAPLRFHAGANYKYILAPIQIPTAAAAPAPKAKAAAAGK